jgi:quercetin dioxygenase-like cupin family protein
LIDRQDLMRKVIFSLAIAAATLAATASGAQTAAPAAPTSQTHAYFTTPLENDASRVVGMQVVTLPPGAGNQFHRHPGDQWTAILEGEVTLTVQGQPPKVLKAGDGNYVPRGVIHRQQNMSDKPVRYMELSIFDKDKPRVEQVK